ncbi:MAG: asparagine--tRNA ligase [Pseudomonadota bacterium]|nr:asparagine--tRNA ligase [Pseudomonadota bacterium]
MFLKNKHTCKDLLLRDEPLPAISIEGWIKTKRSSKNIVFIELNDGSCQSNLQIVINDETKQSEPLETLSTGASISVNGNLIESEGANQKWEVSAESISVLGYCDIDYPLQKKRHSDEFLRGIAHLRGRTNKYAALARIRSQLSFSIHNYFHQNNFVQIHTPIITGSDCEGAGEMFNVEHMLGKENFFGRPAHLTVSGQLPLETYCLSHSRVYTFGPAFRAENSNTARHVSEFWMVEPEIAFADLSDDMDLAENFIKQVTKEALEECHEEMTLFKNYVDKGLEKRLEMLSSRFHRCTYSDCIELLKKSNKNFEFKPEWGKDLQTEHEKFITDDHFKGPIFITDWPKDIKPFYMRLNDDEKTVSCMDLIMPRVGELIGGSAREERSDQLKMRLGDDERTMDDYWWYLETRKYGTVKHAGFGMGFERLIMLLTGVTNIRDVIAYPRTPHSLEF